MISINELEVIKHRPEMLEVAFNYHTMCSRSARRDLYCVHSVMSGLALEIILKSFNSEEVDRQSQFKASYKSKRGHDLVSLLNNIPNSFKNYLFSDLDLEIIEQYRDVFTKDRYLYEIDAKGKSTNCLIKLVGRTIYKMMDIYRYQGSDDPFITEADFEFLCIELNRYNTTALKP
ncbi:hypothetical protein HJ177_20670 [Vibrio parahaemolyticus]|nr:hypothetical protein [Vibrio parahaemolyticus]HCG9220002.1 hypothetical protein [Vibrio parahaemolyticus]